MSRQSGLIRGMLCAAICSLGLWAPTLRAAPVPGQGTWQTSLQARDINGDGITDAFYDSALDVTWLADWNVAGKLTHGEALAWAAGLDEYGVGGWRLPKVVDTGATGCDFSYSGTDCGWNVQTRSGGTVFAEMAYLWYAELGNKGWADTGGNSGQPGWGLANTADFQNMAPSWYWLDPLQPAVFDSPDFFSVGDGSQQFDYHGNDSIYAVAVRDGDIPEPGSFALVFLALCALASTARGRRRGVS